MQPGEKGNSYVTPSLLCSPMSRLYAKTHSKTPIFRLLVKEGAVLQSTVYKGK